MLIWWRRNRRNRIQSGQQLQQVYGGYKPEYYNAPPQGEPYNGPYNGPPPYQGQQFAQAPQYPQQSYVSDAGRQNDMQNDYYKSQGNGPYR